MWIVTELDINKIIKVEIKQIHSDSNYYRGKEAIEKSKRAE